MPLVSRALRRQRSTEQFLLSPGTLTGRPRLDERRDRAHAAVSFDGVICFGGEDWWYHNRGHFDMQIMRQLARDLPVLFVNSIGMRVPAPAEGAMFLRRVCRKLRSVSRGHTRIEENFQVVSPIAAPGALGSRLTGPLLTRQVRSARRRMGIRRPLLWIACPPALEFVRRLDPVGVVYQRTDRYERFTGVDVPRIRFFDRMLKARADLTVFCSARLMEKEAVACRRAILIDHGVAYDRFVTAGAGSGPLPEDVQGFARPRVGFIGGIDRHTFDPGLLRAVARRLPDVSFILVGACSLPAAELQAPNVHLLGQKPYDGIAEYMAGCDVLIMPWQRNAWIEACNPIKLKEYLAVGRPVVSTSFPELDRFRGLVEIADDPDSFAAAIRRAIAEPGDAAARRARVRPHTWRAKTDALLDALRAADLAPRLRPAPDQPEAKGSPPPVVTVHPSVTPVACMLLAGGLTPVPLAATSGRSVLDLWLTARGTVLDHWVERLAALALTSPPTVRVVHGASGPVPWPADPPAGVVRLEREPQPFRGPAGVVRDLCQAYGPEDHVLVCEANRYVTEDLRDLLQVHRARAADVTVACNPDHTPAGIYLVRCKALRLIPRRGFLDLKEQWLAMVRRAGLRAVVHRFAASGSLPLHTRAQFLRAAAAANGVGADHDPQEASGRFRAGNASGLRVVCPGALIGPACSIIDSVVMPGARVGPRAVVARSVICPDAVIQAGEDLADAVRSAYRRRTDHARTDARSLESVHRRAVSRKAA